MGAVCAPCAHVGQGPDVRPADDKANPDSAAETCNTAGTSLNQCTTYKEYILDTILITPLVTGMINTD